MGDMIHNKIITAAAAGTFFTIISIVFLDVTFGSVCVDASSSGGPEHIITCYREWMQSIGAILFPFLALIATIAYSKTTHDKQKVEILREYIRSLADEISIIDESLTPLLELMTDVLNEAVADWDAQSFSVIQMVKNTHGRVRGYFERRAAHAAIFFDKEYEDCYQELDNACYEIAFFYENLKMESENFDRNDLFVKNFEYAHFEAVFLEFEHRLSQVMVLLDARRKKFGRMHDAAVGKILG